MIIVRVFNTHSKYRVQSSGTKAVVHHVLKSEQHSNAYVNVIFVDKKRMIEMNGTYLNHWYSTDVICFPLSDHSNILEGEIYINLDQARRQATMYNVTFKNEYARLIVHGILHLIGYNDKTKDQKKVMTKLENYYLEYLQKKSLKL